jgi:hypothetical protein
MVAENTWPNWHVKPKRPMIRHKWEPVEGLFKTDICSKCGCVRRWEQSIGMYSYFEFFLNGSCFNHRGYRAPTCVLPNTKKPNT